MRRDNPVNKFPFAVAENLSQPDEFGRLKFYNNGSLVLSGVAATFHRQARRHLP